MITYNSISQLPIRERSFKFAVEIVKFCTLLKEERQYEIAKQLIRSGTSIGANIRESNNGFTKKDFIFKVNIAQKETDETIYWLEIIKEVSDLKEETNHLLHEAMQLLKIIRTISINAKNKQ
ncbi:MAG: four helix bundle protein [Bacteroidota bacterium]|nr:four helix bundle protein [Bacteroidota bacterium]